MTRSTWLVLAAVAVLSACSTARVADPVQPEPVQTPHMREPQVKELQVKEPAPRPAGDSERLLGYFEHVRKLPPGELTKEHDAVRHAFVSPYADALRVRYAMLLSLPGNAFSDDTRALEVLEPLLRNSDARLHGIAFMLNAHIQELRRAQGLQQKLDALKSLEMNLIERDPGAGKRR